MPVEYMNWYRIYTANNWGIYVSWRLSVRPGAGGAGSENVNYVIYIHWYWIYIANNSNFQTVQISWKPSKLSNKTVRKLSRLSTKLSRPSRNFTNRPKTFKTVCHLSRLSGILPDCPETQTVRHISRLSPRLSRLS